MLSKLNCSNYRIIYILMSLYNQWVTEMWVRARRPRKHVLGSMLIPNTTEKSLSSACSKSIN